MVVSWHAILLYLVLYDMASVNLLCRVLYHDMADEVASVGEPSLAVWAAVGALPGVGSDVAHHVVLQTVLLPAQQARVPPVRQPL